MGREEGGDWMGVTYPVIGLSQKGRGSKVIHYTNEREFMG